VSLHPAKCLRRVNASVGSIALDHEGKLREARVYERYGFAFPQRGVAKSSDEAVALASRIGYPVALKIASPDILHKSDVGGVELGCESQAEVRAAYSRILLNVREKAPNATLEGIAVEEMCAGQLELIIGLIDDQQFGLTIMFGLGGVFTELIRDVSFRVLPITPRDALGMIREIKANGIIQGYRGAAAVSEDVIVDLLMKASAMGMDLQDKLVSLDLNPIVVDGQKHVVLDAKMQLRDGGHLPPVPAPNPAYLEGFFGARSVALVGASATPGKIGNSVLDSLANHEYRGTIYPVNPRQSDVMGLRAYPSLASIPNQVDLVVVTASLKVVPEVIEQCAAKGVHNLVVVSAGGKELGAEGAELEENIKRLAEKHGVRIVGCNCLGVFDGDSRLDTFFQTHERMRRPRKGPVAMMSQSGTVGLAFLEAADDVGVSKFVSYGNRIDVDEADLLDYLANDSATKVIVCYVEGFGCGRKFLETARRVSAQKPIVAYKAGRSQEASKVAASHTGSLAGSLGVTTGVFRQAGIVSVDSFEELHAVAATLAWQPRAQGPRIAMISNGAGTMVQALDVACACGLRTDPLSKLTSHELRNAYPPFYQVQNPVDLTGSASSVDYRIGIAALLRDENVDIVMPWFVFQDTPLDEGIVDVLDHINQTASKPILCGCFGGPYTQVMASRIRERGVPVHDSVRTWVTSARALAEAGIGGADAFDGPILRPS
jgi:3-hydroxypropionyl-CoA synthetase (ADP-forming)